MSDKTTNETIAQIFFEKIKEEEEYEFYQCRHCLEGKGCIKRRKGSGWINLENHAKSTHNDRQETVEASIVREGQGAMKKFVQQFQDSEVETRIRVLSKYLDGIAARGFRST